MNKKRILLFVLLFFSFFSFSFHIAKAQEETDSPIRSADSVQIGKNIIFQVNDGVFSETVKIQRYRWEFGDGTTSAKEEDVHIYAKPGRFTVKLRLDLLPEGERTTASQEFSKSIFVYERAFFLITSTPIDDGRLQALGRTAEEQNIYLSLVFAEAGARIKEGVSREIDEKLLELEESDTVLLWADQVELLTLLSGLSDRVDFRDKQIAVITEGNIRFQENILAGVFRVISPQRIIITRREAMDEFFTTPRGQDVLQVIAGRGYDFSVLDAKKVSQVTIFNIGSTWIHYFREKGVEDSVLLLVLILPVIVTLVTFLRLMIGLSPAGSRLPILFTYSFLILGWQITLIALPLLAGVSYVFRLFFFQSHLMYAAKIGVLTSVLGVALLLIISGMLAFSIGEFDLTSILFLVIVSLMVDRMAGVEGEKNILSLLQVLIETIGIAFLGFLLISSESLKILLLSHPEVLLIFILANILMGRFTGLRLTEFFRFRELLKYSEEE